MVIAQGSPSSALVPLGLGVGVFFFVVGLVTLAVQWMGRTARAGEAAVRRTRVRAVIIISFAITLACAGVVLAVLESGPTQAWRSRTRTNVVTAVDARTNGRLPIEVSFGYDGEDPYLILSATKRRPDEVEVRWNVACPLVVTAPGFEQRVVTLTADSPHEVVVPLERSTPKSPATRP